MRRRFTSSVVITTGKKENGVSGVDGRQGPKALANFNRTTADVEVMSDE